MTYSEKSSIHIAEIESVSVLDAPIAGIGNQPARTHVIGIKYVDTVPDTFPIRLYIGEIELSRFSASTGISKVEYLTQVMKPRSGDYSFLKLEAHTRIVGKTYASRSGREFSWKVTDDKPEGSTTVSVEIPVDALTLSDTAQTELNSLISSVYAKSVEVSMAKEEATKQLRLARIARIRDSYQVKSEDTTLEAVTNPTTEQEGANPPKTPKGK